MQASMNSLFGAVGALVCTILLVVLGDTTPDQTAVRAFVGARIIPVTADEIADGVLLVEGDTIVAVGARGEVTIPDGAEVIDVTGQVLFPGLICTHSHIGNVSGGDRSSPIQPEVRMLTRWMCGTAPLRRRGRAA